MRDEFLITRQGKQYVFFAGLLDEAHGKGLRGIDTDLIQVPADSNDNVAVVKATVEMEDGKRFSGIGDASPKNVERNVVPQLIGMAETRAKARALRDAVNVGFVAVEELFDGDPTPLADNHAPAARSPGVPSIPTRGSSPRTNEAPHQAVTRVSARDTRIAEQATTNGQSGEKPVAQRSGESKQRKARKSQVDLVKTLAVEWAGEGGVERLEKRLGKPLGDLTRSEADEWIDRLTPEGRE